jgi:hypothetical protein
MIFSESPALARNVPSVFIWDVLAQNLEIVTIEKRVFRYRLGHGFCLCFGWLSLYRLFYVGLPSCTTQGRKDTRRNDGRVSLFYSVELVYFNLAVLGCITAKILLLRHCITAKIPSNSQYSRGQIPTGQRRPIPTGQRRGPLLYVAPVGILPGPAEDGRQQPLVAVQLRRVCVAVHSPILALPFFAFPIIR